MTFQDQTHFPGLYRTFQEALEPCKADIIPVVLKVLEIAASTHTWPRRRRCILWMLVTTELTLPMSPRCWYHRMSTSDLW